MVQSAILPLEPMPQPHLIGVISDTHGLLRPEAIKALHAVELIIHAGDVDQPEILSGLKDIAPTVAVRGNIDYGMWAEGLPQTRTVEVGAVRIHVIHNLGDLSIDPARRWLRCRDLRAFSQAFNHPGRMPCCTSILAALAHGVPNCCRAWRCCGLATGRWRRNWSSWMREVGRHKGWSRMSKNRSTRCGHFVFGQPLKDTIELVVVCVKNPAGSGDATGRLTTGLTVETTCPAVLETTSNNRRSGWRQ